MTENDIKDGRTFAIISYITIFGTLIAFFMNNEKRSNFAYFHIRQALGLWLTFFLLGFAISSFDSWLMTFGFYLFFSVLFIYGFVNAINGKAQKVPILGDFYQKTFSGIQ